VDMLSFAPRISHRLVDAVVRLDDASVPIAETHRRVAAEATRLGLPRPSYQRIRELVHESRRFRRRRGPTTASVLLDVALRTRPPDALLEHMSGVGVTEIAHR
jgi:hypothetical protein